MKNRKLGFALIGEMGVGKSTFVNTLFDRTVNRTSDSKLACTGEVEPRNLSYNGNNIFCWDLPGVGDPREYPDDFTQKIMLHILKYLEADVPLQTIGFVITSKDYRVKTH